MFVRHLAAFLVCLAVTAVADDACASIVVPQSPFELSADDVLNAGAESGATSASKTGSDNSGPSTPLPDQEQILQLGLNAYAGPLGSGSSGSTGGSSPPSSGSYGGLVASSTSGFHVDDALLGWLTQSKWLDIPMPPGISLLRPPQAV